MPDDWNKKEEERVSLLPQLLEQLIFVSESRADR